MNEQTSPSPPSRDVLMEIVVKKIEAQEQKIKANDQGIAAVNKTVKAIPDHSGEIQTMKKGLEEVKTVVDTFKFPTDEVNKLYAKLDAALALFKRPIESKIQHHHYVPSIIWTSAGLFLVLVLTCSGWLMTASCLDQYRANDTKYRYLKLKSEVGLKQSLFSLDSVYKAGFPMKDSVLQWEQDEQKAIELHQNLMQKQVEDSLLKEKTEALEKKNKERRSSKQ